MTEITQLLATAEKGEPQAVHRLLPLVYEELRQLAAQKLAREKAGQTLQPTALVHEAYLRLVGPASDPPDQPSRSFANRRHFFAAAAEAMRRILVDNARRKLTEKHGGGFERRHADEIEWHVPSSREDLLALDVALEKLTAADPQAAELVQLRYFAGCSIPEAAELLQLSPRSVDRLWAYAKAFLHQELRKNQSD